MRITLIISSLKFGGAERVMSVIANYWASSKKHVTLITLDSADRDFYSLDSRVKRVALQLAARSDTFRQAFNNNRRRIKQLRREIIASRPDVVLSFEDKTNILTLIAARPLKVPVLISERTDPRYHKIGRFWEACRVIVYPMASAVIVQSGSVRHWAENIIPKEFISVIPNPVWLTPARCLDTDNLLPARQNIVSMGRLEPEKGFDLMLTAFARCAAKYPDWAITILGEGTERSRLEKLANRLGIEDKTSFPGVIKDPTTILQSADLFVMSSHYEGFPNALLEAMTCGLPVISTDCPSGPREIIRNGENGILVPPENVDTLAAAMDKLMGNPEERRRLADGAVKVTESFGLNKVMEMWEDVIKAVTHEL